jgi:hypothetical protein
LAFDPFRHRQNDEATITFSENPPLSNRPPSTQAASKVNTTKQAAIRNAERYSAPRGIGWQHLLERFKPLIPR